MDIEMTHVLIISGSIIVLLLIILIISVRHLSRKVARANEQYLELRRENVKQDKLIHLLEEYLTERQDRQKPQPQE